MYKGTDHGQGERIITAGADSAASWAVIDSGRTMGRWTRDELENAFADFQRVALAAGSSGDWNAWADLFTEDATYVESNYGRMGGREAIRKWITSTMGTPPSDQMCAFPVEWYMIDEDRGWITCQVWNRMADPGDGSLHQAYNFTLLKYAGDAKWSY